MWDDYSDTYGFGSYGSGYLSYSPMNVWDLNYSTTSSGGSGDGGGGFWGDLGDSVTDFFGDGKSGEVIEESADAAAAAAIAKGFEELYDALGVNSNGQSQDSGNSGNSGGSDSGSEGMQIPSWAAPVGIVVVALFLVELVTS
jgi:hypothetical protein